MDDNFFVYRENYISGVGTPLLLISLGNRTVNSQGVESYLFLYGKQKLFLPELRDWYFTDKIPSEVLQAEYFLAEAVAASEARLENQIAEKHPDQYDAFLLKRSGFQVAQDAALEIINLRARQGFRKELSSIANGTQNGRLRALVRERCQNEMTSTLQPFE